MSPFRRSTLNLYEFKNYLKDKRVLVVGNNLTALDKDQGELIDSYDVVIRFGKGSPNGREKQLGTRTDVWVTGSFRIGARDMYPEKTIVLYNNAVFYESKLRTPKYPHISMYSFDEIRTLDAIYNTSTGRRLSAGAITAHWLYFVVGTFKSISFINFDFFQQHTLFHDKKQDFINVSSSWHLPIAVKRFVNKEKPTEHPAHNTEAEKQLFDLILRNDNAHFIGDRLDESRLVQLDNLAWDDTRAKV